ncbi:MaoC family dehydratase [Rhodospirillum rubrum]|uniref:MaoC-like dehydratase n=1 Tax=Rhodospirillum rubrum (strain ATCC 11170 / ATH 1.1.1 / DSM 467 / LMG 4362 / NCIMB 8255 / S1) TaxID=269796 RepID=Q2RN12_RHORT|nr:MaoC family dehydratase [Rhodospirillum rubrum]ABC24483.1 MaoC-like dehydratase [Rhodospirillum rubrum ATCC 11170]AEO50234.1 MaoC-like dehydratase [Rhodospirillum rubrum F11]MBK1663515.1 hypothetical protein [Rhodospirillum rubrum]MBK1677311.1 hypothetical protein [Rhodospirillum rubrum]MBK5956209.1 hypothetical protein [Rhodospirillum rubrum]
MTLSSTTAPLDQPIPQATADAFCALTGDDQWIHIDPARAEAEGLAGGDTVLPGALLLSLAVGGLGKALGYPEGTRSWQRSYERVRFLRPAPVGSRLRLEARESRRRPAGTGREVVVANVSLYSDLVEAGPVMEGCFTSLLEVAVQPDTAE